MSLYKKLFLSSVVFFVYMHGADQDLGPRIGSAKRPALERSNSEKDVFPLQAKRQKTDEIDSKSLDLVQRDNLLDLEQVKKNMREATQLMSNEAIEKNFRIVEIRQQMANKISPEDSKKLTGTCDDLKAMLVWQRKCREYPYTFFSNPRDTKETKLSTYLTGIIHHAKDDIKVACYHITFFPVARALVERKKAGVAVMLLTNRDQSGPTTAVNYMNREGLDIFVPKKNPGKYPPSLHTKFFVFKNVLGRKITITGSYNPTGNADDNEYNDLHISDMSKDFAQYTKQFNAIKADCVKTEDFEGSFEKLRKDKTKNNFDRNRSLERTYDSNKVPQSERRLFERYPNPVGPVNRIQPDESQD